MEKTPEENKRNLLDLIGDRVVRKGNLPVAIVVGIGVRLVDMARQFASEGDDTSISDSHWGD